MEDGAKINNGEMDPPDLSLAQMMELSGLIPPPSNALKKKKQKRVPLNKTTETILDDKGNPREVIKQSYYLQDCSSSESEDDLIRPEDEAQIEQAMASSDAPDGARRSGREKNPKLRIDNLKNEL